MAWDTLHRSAEQSAVLTGAVDRAQPGSVYVLDLDSCLFDTRPRQLRILRSFAQAHGWPELYRVRIEHFQTWDLGNTLDLAGVQKGPLKELQAYWWERFFDGDWLAHDVPLPGAVPFVHTLHRRGATLVYLTGRHDPMRAGTLESLRTWDFPLEDGRITLLTKPRFEIQDHVFKRASADLVRKLGAVAFCIDNEPSNVNLFAEIFPEALVVWMDTDHSPLPVRVRSDLPRVRGFLY